MQTPCLCPDHVAGFFSCTAHPRDVLRGPRPGSVALQGWLHNRLQAGVDNQLKKLEYPRMVDYFRNRPNPFASGEFWGKTMRSACVSYQYRPDPELLAILDASVDDLLSTQTPDGCISARTYDEQPKSSDLWERKYVLLGLLHYYEIAPRPEVLEAMIRMADYTLAQVGPAPKTPITETGWAFYGIESSSILEPMMRLHQLTGEARYLAFARYIVEETGGCKRGNIFEAALQGVAPRMIGDNGVPKESIAKSYEMMSCFEGLADYYRVTGDERWKEAALTLYRNIRDQEITILGSGGGDQPYNLGPGTGEQWNNLAAEQTNPDMTLMMETCVTVTWMKFCYHILRLTGDSTVADEIEKSIYNALAGAQKPTGDYYDYFQQLNGSRGGKVNFSTDIAGFELSCCTANGPMGMALIPFFAVMEGKRGPVVNLYAPGTWQGTTPLGGPLSLRLETDYPRSGAVLIEVMTNPPAFEAAEKESFAIALRIPAWSRTIRLAINGVDVSQRCCPGSYAVLDMAWHPGDRIELTLDMTCRLVPSPGGVKSPAGQYQALLRGPLALARDRRLGGDGDIHAPVRIKSHPDGTVELLAMETLTSITPAVYDFAQVAFLVATEHGFCFPVIDYASAGNTWDESSAFVTWIPKG
ncbi:hypothetical protein DB346_09040 [Verrucomicrobia bacterium LW23]|nr:hypothetical protein DB346_09040 [Verrucomicrobia bacterium LW23]